jgi:chromosomal replication initiation ATPase DnaA
MKTATTQPLPLHLVSPLLDAVCTQYDVPRDVVTRPGAKRYGGSNVEKARQVACYLLRNYGFKMKEIGSIIGYATHCQAIKNVQLTLRVMSVDKDFAAEVQALDTRLAEANQAHKAQQRDAAIAA